MTVTNTTNFQLGGSDIKFDNGRVYSNSGPVIDPVNLFVLGTFTAPGLSGTSFVVPDSSMDRAFFLYLNGSTAVIYAFNATNFGLVGTVSIPGIAGTAVSSLIRWGDDALAFRSDGNQLFLFRIPKSWFSSGPALSVSPVSIVFPPQPVDTTSVPRSVTMTNKTSGPIAISSIAASGDFAQTNTCGSSIAALATCTISVTFTPTMQGKRSGILTILDGSSASPHIVGLSGIGDVSFPVPSITSLSPYSAAMGSAALTLTVTGGNFVPESVVRWNGLALATTFINGNTLAAAIPASSLAGLESADVMVFNPSPDGGTSNSAAFTIYRTLALATKDLIYDRFGRRICASTPGLTPNGNTITSIDPFTVALGSSVFIGSEPGKLAVSDNGQYLYVSLDGAGVVRRLDLASQVPGLQFPLGSDPLAGPYYATDLKVSPGNSPVVAVARTGRTVAIYDNGVKRSTETTIFTPSSSLSFSNSAFTLYGSDANGRALRTMSVNANGVTVTNTSPLQAGVIEFGNGRIYGTTGTVADPVTGTLFGTFNTNPPYVSSLVFDSTLDRVFFLVLNGSTPVIQVFNATNLTLVGSLSLPRSYGRHSRQFGALG